MSNARPPKDFLVLNSVIGGHLSKDIFSSTICFQKRNAHWSGSIQGVFGFWKHPHLFLFFSPSEKETEQNWRSLHSIKPLATDFTLHYNPALLFPTSPSPVAMQPLA
jgi:hypothetical protein